jgi:putative heme iron utilization protein
MKRSVASLEKMNAEFIAVAFENAHRYAAIQEQSGEEYDLKAILLMEMFALRSKIDGAIEAIEKDLV